MRDSAVKTGRCLYGAVYYKTRNTSGKVVACHCGQCRRSYS